MSNRRSMTDFPRNEAGLVDEFIGTAYDTVKNVYDNLDEIGRLDGVLGDIPDLAQSTVDSALAGALPPIMEDLTAEVDKAQQWAEGTQPDPEVPESKSSKEWADTSKANADAGIVEIGVIVDGVTVTSQQTLTEMDQLKAEVTSIRDQTLLYGNLYPDVAAGLAATTEGAYFSVLGQTDDQFTDLYQKVDGQPIWLKNYPTADLVLDLEANSRFAIESAQLRNMTLQYLWAILDKSKKVILGINERGTVDAILDRMPGLTMVGDYAWAIVDQNKVVLFGIKWSGEIVMYPSVLASTLEGYAWDEGLNGNRDVYTMVNGINYQLTSKGDNSSPRVSSGQVTYVSRDGLVAGKTVPLPVPGSVADFVKRMIHVIFLGQSLACGIKAGASVTTAPMSANRVLTLADGVQLTSEAGVLDPSMVLPLTPLMSKPGTNKEPPCVQAAAEVNRTRKVPSDAGLVISNHGRGAQGINSLNKGTIPYNNSLTAITQVKADCDAKGLPYSVPCISWNQGQHDGAMAEGVYYALLVQLQLDYEADIQAITGQTGRIPMIITQMSNWTAPAYNRAFSWIPHEQYRVSIDFPDRFSVSGPQYWLPSVTDGIHLPGESYASDGVALAGALGEHINGRKWKPTACVSAVLSGNKVTLRFDVPEGPLTLDTYAIADPGMYGLRWIDSSMSATITSAEVTGFNTMELILSNVPTGTGQMVGVADIGVAGSRAGPTTGPRTCIRDSSTRFDHRGNPVYNWACHNRVPVTLS